MANSTMSHRAILQRIARRAMLERGLLPDFSSQALAQLAEVKSASVAEALPARDLRTLLWSSIDNDDSRDLDQLTVAEALRGNSTRLLVAIADVDATVKSGSPIDRHASHNTTSVYTAAEIFPMLPERLSTDLTSLNLEEDRLAMVVDITVGAGGALEASDIYQAQVRNRAKLAYNSLAVWLESGTAMPEAVAAVEGLAENLRLQDRAAQSLRNFRHLHGALNFETIQAKPEFAGDEVWELKEEKPNRAKNLIEDLMIAANGVTARYLSTHNSPSVRRIVRVPKRWERIVDIAREQGFTLPAEPDSRALESFLVHAREKDPEAFPDLSLAVIKLMGAGEYVVEGPDDTDSIGHFGLAVRDYSHSTAPNRRFPDLITQRLLKAVMLKLPAPYTYDELDALAKHCTEAEDAADKVERQVGKSAAALLLESRLGEHFDGIVTGASAKGTWVRVFHPPVEGRLVQGYEGVDVGQHVRVRLQHTDVERGFIDFSRA